jgi:ABC-type phosphate/phosphonate transport system substrate-binding protein
VITEVKSYPTVQALVDGMKKGEVDVAFLNTAGYFLASEWEENFEPVVQLNLPQEKRNEYRSIMVVGGNVEMNSLEEVLKLAADFVLMLVSPTSTSGALVPRLKLSSLQPGIPERFFLEVQYANTHEETMRHALLGEFALCSFGIGTYRKLGADTTRLKKLWESPPIPLGPVLFKKSLTGSTREQLEKVFLDMHKDNPEILQSIKDAWSEAASSDRFIKFNPDSYGAILDLSVNREVASFIAKSMIK